MELFKKEQGTIEMNDSRLSEYDTQYFEYIAVDK